MKKLTNSITKSTLFLAALAFVGYKYIEYTKVVDNVQQAAKRTIDYKHGDMMIKTSIECSPPIFNDFYTIELFDTTIIFKGTTVTTQRDKNEYKFKLVENDFYVYEEITDDKEKSVATVYKDRIQIGYTTYDLYNCSMKN